MYYMKLKERLLYIYDLKKLKYFKVFIWPEHAVSRYSKLVCWCNLSKSNNIGCLGFIVLRVNFSEKRWAGGNG
jgi:hypothetical protein